MDGLIVDENESRLKCYEKKIVVIDDEKPIADILQFHFQMEGFLTKCAYDGQEGFRLVEETKPDIVLLDLMLPVLNGIEVCKKYV